MVEPSRRPPNEEDHDGHYNDDKYEDDNYDQADDHYDDDWGWMEEVGSSAAAVTCATILYGLL